MIKACFFDIDGTLIPFHTNTMPESTRSALETLRRKGIKLFLATGRGPQHIGFMEKLFDFDGAVTFNGQYCFDKSGIFLDRPLSSEAVSGAFSYLQKNQIAGKFETVEDGFYNLVNDRVRDINARARALFRMLDLHDPEPRPDEITALKQPVYQITVFVSPREEAGMMRCLPGCKGLRWSDEFVNVVDQNGGKAAGIEEVCKKYGFGQKEIMAFGDGGNDIDMLEYAGIGIAMGNAGSDAKAAADYVTTAVDDNGICNALKHFEVI